MSGVFDKRRKTRYTTPKRGVTAVKKNTAWVLPAVIGAVTLFIWSQSLLPGAVSAQESGFIARLLAGMLGLETIPVWLHHLVRKAAHFTEFALLGGLWRGYAPRRGCRLSWLYGLGVAAVDECLQFLSPDRGPALADVGIDYAGSLCGWLAVAGVAY